VLGYEELTEPERAVWSAIETGALVELPLGSPAADDPLTGESWGEERQIRGQLLYELLTGTNGPKAARHRALWVAGARITGILNLEASKLVCPVILRGCFFDQPLNLRGAQAPAVRLPNCYMPSLYAEQLQTDGNLELNERFRADGEVSVLQGHIGGAFDCSDALLSNGDGLTLIADGLTVDGDLLCSRFTARGEVRLVGARIGGRTFFYGATLNNPEGAALDADQLTVGLGMSCSGGFTAKGEVSLIGANINGGLLNFVDAKIDGAVVLIGAHVSGELQFDGASLTNPQGAALDADQLTVEQSMSCRNGFTAKGEISLSGAKIKGDLDFIGATLTDLEGSALDADQLTVEQNMLCANGFTAQGSINMRGAHIGGELDFSGARVDGRVDLVGAHISAELSFYGASLTNLEGTALGGDGVTVEGGMFLGDGFTAKGEVRLVNAKIKPVLGFLDGSTLTNFKGFALNGGALTVEGSMLCGEGFTANGEIRLLSANISGQLNFLGARLINPEGVALDADRLTVKQGMTCREGFTANGEVRLRGAEISGGLSFVKAALINPQGIALNADSLTVEGNMSCGEGFTAKGEVRLPGANINGPLNFNGATLTNPNGSALNIEHLRADTILLRTQGPPQGIVSLRNARTDTFYDSEGSWPQSLRLSGFTYGTLVATPNVGTRARLRWLERDKDGYIPQLYEQLADFYRKVGHDDDARKVAITKQRRRRSTLSWPGKIWSSLLDWIVGYGYQTWKAGAWLLAMVMLGWWIFDRAYPVYLTAAKPPGQRPLFHAGAYTLDLLLPFADLGYQSAFIAGGWARGCYLAWNLAGWVLITAVVAALSGLIKRD
jgi:hypothetical protein